MGYRNTSVAYGTVSKFFHWLIFLLVLFMLIYGYFMGEVAKEYKPLAFNIHKLVGLLILAVMILRVIWALINVKPALQGQVSFLERVAERLVHFLLSCTSHYAFKRLDRIICCKQSTLPRQFNFCLTYSPK